MGRCANRALPARGSNRALRACFAAGASGARDEFMGAALRTCRSDCTLRASLAGWANSANRSGGGAALPAG